MTKKDLLDLKPGTLIKITGVDTFIGRLERIEHVIETDIADIYRVYFKDADPVICVEVSRIKIQRLEEE